MKVGGISLALGVLLILALVHGLVSAAPPAGDALTAHSTAATTVELVGHLGGVSQGIVVAGNYGYTTLGRELAVLDLSDPANPTRVGYTMLPVIGEWVDVEGYYAYVLGYLGGSSQMVVVDVSVPTQPIIVGSLDIAGFGIDVSGPYAYVVGDSFQVVDISDPAHPALAGSSPTAGVDIQVSGNYAYVAGGYLGAGLQVVNVANPSAPVQVGAAPATALGVFVAGGYAYVADFTSSSCDLRVFDVSNPANPQQVGSEELFTGAWSEAHDVYVSGGYAYVAGSAYVGGGRSYGGIDVVDISDPAHPHSVGDYVAPDIWKTTAVYVANSHAYLSAGSDGLRVMNVSDPSAPTEVHAWLPASGGDVVVSDADPSGSEPTYAYLATWGLGIVDVSDPAYPMTVGRYPAPPPNYGENRVALAGPYVYVSDVVGTLYVLDVSDPVQPVVAGSYKDRRAAFFDLDVDEAEAYVYLAGGGVENLLILDVSDPAHIAPAGAYDLPTAPTAIQVSGTYAYLSGTWADPDNDEEGLWVLDISDPAHPAQMGYLDIAGGAQDVQVQGDYAYVLHTDHSGWETVTSLLTIDVADPAQPALAGTVVIATGLWIERLHVSGDRAYVAGDGLWALDISDPANPALLDTYTTSSEVHFSGVYAAGKHIYAVGDGVYIFRLSTLALEANPAALNWLAETGGSDPPPRPVSIQSFAQPLTWTAHLSPAVDWLAVTPRDGVTPAVITATAHISGLEVGQYTTTLVISSPLVSEAQGIPVTLSMAEEIFDIYLPLLLRQ